MIALALVGVPLGLVFLSRRGLAPVPLAGIGAVALIALAVGGRFVQDHYLDERYSSTAPDYPKTEQPAVELGQGLGAAYDWARGTQRPEDRALRDDGSALPVRALGRELEQRRPLHRRARAARLIQRDPECPEWIGALNDGDYDYVITTPTYHQDDPAADTVPVQRDWISRAGNVQRVAGANLVDVWKITGPLDPLACAAPAGAAPSGGTPLPSVTGE